MRHLFRLLVVAGGWLSGVASSACGPANNGGKIVIGVAADFSVFLPVVRNTALDSEMRSMLYLALTTARWGDGRVEYESGDLALAERWELDADSTTLTYVPLVF